MNKYKMAIVRPDGNVIPKGFYNSQELGLAQQLSVLNVDVDVYYAGNVEKITSSRIESYGPGQVNLIELPYYIIPLIQQAIFPGLIKELRKSKYDLIQVNEYNDIISTQVVNYADKNYIPVIVYQGMYKNLSGRFNGLYTFFHDKLLISNFINKVSIALTKTKVAADFLMSKGFNHVSVMPVGLDTNAFVQSKNQINNNELNNLYDIPANHKVILYIGNFEQRRNINFLLDIANNCKKLPITFLFIGEGELLVQAQQKVITQNMSNVRLPGRLPQKELSTIYQSSDLFLLASDYEIYGMVVLEAMYYGIPVISNNTAGPASIIDSNINGVIINDLNVEEWSTVIKKLFSDNNILKTMKNRAKTKIEQELTWEKIAQKYLDVILKKYCH
jgi:glycosyltransferase involved in cell wall biosynthesis